MNKSKYFTRTCTCYRYATKVRGHCTTRNLVYLITCTNCAKQCVGETKREFKFRIANIYGIHVSKEKHLYPYILNEIDHLFENMIFQIIQILPTDPEDDRSTTRRSICERYWIYQLHSLKPFGLNVFGEDTSKPQSFSPCVLKSFSIY